MKKIISFLIVASFLFGGFSALAQTTTAETTKFGIEPDSVFYFLENWKEQIQLFFTFDLEKKAKQYQKLAEERLAEYQRMLDKGKDEVAAKVLAKYEKQLGQALETAKKLKTKGVDAAEEKINNVFSNISKHIEVLQDNLEKVPEAAKKGLQNAIEAAQKVLEKFENEDGSEPIVGGDKDEHDCLGSAGYSWCEAKEKCLRVFEEWCADQATELIVDIREVSDTELKYQKEEAFAWMIFKNNQIANISLTGSHYKAENINREQFNKIEKYLRDNLESDKYNQADGVTGGLRGYISGYMACTLNFVYPIVEKHENAPSIPNTDVVNVDIRCGFYNINLINAENLIEKTGNLTKQNGNWVLVYEEPGKPALTLKLEFNANSLCEKGAQKDICVLENFKIGSRVRISGVINGNNLNVHTLNILEEI